MDVSQELTIGLAIGSVVFSAGAYWQTMRTTRRDVNGLGGVVRRLEERERRHYGRLLTVLLASKDPETQLEARRLVGEL